jgi:ADP-ribose pyrophosphatase
MILTMDEPVQSERVYDGRLFQVDVVDVPRGDAGVRQYEVVRHPGAVVIVPVRDDGSILLIRNDRVAVGETLWEFPAGKLEPGEAPALAAARELEEETGYRAAALEPIGTFYTSPGFASERMHAYAARGLTHVGQRLEPGELIEVVKVGGDAMLEMIDSGEIRDGKTLAAALLWMRSTERS